MTNEYKGLWWLPAKPQAKVHGTLRVSETDDTILDLDGTLIDVQPFMPVVFKPDIILGQSMEGKLLTLYKCIQIHVGGSFPSGLTTSRLLVQTAFLGAHFEIPSDVKFKYVDVRFRHLNDWVGISGFNVKTQESTTTISYMLPSKVSAVIDDMQISIIFSESQRFDFVHEISIRQDASFRIETSSESSFEKFESLIYHLQNLLMLALEEQTSPEVIDGYSEKFVLEFREKKHLEPITIIFRYDGNGSHRSHFRFLFRFNEVKTQFQLMLKNWFGKIELLEPVFLGYFAPLHLPIYLEQKFLGYISAIESYHRRVIKGFGLPPEEYERIMVEIMKCIPPQHLDWFSEKLKYNEPSQRRRLKAMIERFSWIDFGGNEFVNRVIITRNYLTHFEEELKEAAAKGDELMRLTLKLELLIKMTLLTELGFEQKEVEQMTKRTNAYQMLFGKTAMA